DRSRYGDDYLAHKKEVEEILPEMEFYDKFYNNLVPFKPAPVLNVCSTKDEYLPMVSPDNELIFYTRKGSDDARGVVENVVEEFTVSLRPDIAGNFDSGDRLKKPFNTAQYSNY